LLLSLADTLALEQSTEVGKTRIYLGKMRIYRGLVAGLVVDNLV
jgi:hypothetical protein